VISGPSGVGKSTILKVVREEIPRIVFGVSATTRDKRPTEDGSEYYFTSEARFIHMVSENAFVEYTKRNDTYYGTLWSELEKEKTGTLLLDLDADGATEIRKRYPRALLIMVLPPSKAVLEARLRGRKDGVSEDEIRFRLNEAEREMAMARYYDYVVINNELSAAVRQVCEIINKAINGSDTVACN